MGAVPSVRSGESGAEALPGLADEMLGEAYRAVKKIAEHIDELINLAPAELVTALTSLKTATEAAAITAGTANTAAALARDAAALSRDQAATSAAAAAQSVTDITTGLASKVALTAVGVTVAPLDGTGKVPSANLPSYVDDVLEFPNQGAFPAVGEAGKLYIDTSVVPNLAFRWGSSQYFGVGGGGAGGGSITSTDQLAEGATNKYYTDARAQAALAGALAGKQASHANLTSFAGLTYTAKAVVTMTAAGTFANTLVGQAAGNILDKAAGDALYQAKGTYLSVAGDGGLEVGSYIDFHYPSLGDGADFKVRLLVDNGGSLTVSNPGNVFTLTGNTLWLRTDKMLLQHNDSNGYIRTQVGNLYLGAGGNTYMTIGAAGGVTVTGNLTSTNDCTATHLIATGADGSVTINARDTGVPAVFYNAGGTLRYFANGSDRITFESNGRFQAQDIVANRGDGTGVVYFGSVGGGKYLYYDGTNFNITGPLVVSGLLSSAGRLVATQLTGVNSVGAGATISDGSHMGIYNKLATAGQTFTFNSTPSTGFSAVFVNRSGGAITIACPGGYYKNGGALATTNISVPANAKFSAFHEGGGVWTFDGNI